MTAILSCCFFMALVGVISYRRTRGQTHSREGYFLAGHGLTGTFIAGSLLLTNLSAEQLIGLNGSAYAFNLSSMAWEVTAAVAIVIMALVLLPRYLTGGFTTLPEYLESRFDVRVRRGDRPALSAGLWADHHPVRAVFGHARCAAALQRARAAPAYRGSRLWCSRSGSSA